MGWFYIEQDTSRMAFPADLNPQNQPLKCSRSQIRHKWLEFHPLAHHAVSSPHGRRVSVALYTPQGWKKLANSDVQELLAMGFRLPQHETPTYALATTSIQRQHQGGDIDPMMMTAPQHSTSAPLSIALISESLNHMTKLMQGAGHRVDHSCHHVQAIRRCLPEDMQALAADLRDNPPDLLWLHYTGHPHPGRRAQTRLLLPWIQAVRKQHPRVQVLLSCRYSDIPVREEIVNAAPSEAWQVVLPHYHSFRSCHALPPATSPERCFNVIFRSTYAFPTHLNKCQPHCREHRHRTLSASACTDYCHLFLVSQCPRSTAADSPHTTSVPAPVPPASFVAADVTSVPTPVPSAPSTAADATGVPSSAPSYPTAAAIRSKQQQKAATAAGTRRRRVTSQEQHHDDCGSDFSSINDPADLEVEATVDPRSLRFRSGDSCDAPTTPTTTTTTTTSTSTRPTKTTLLRRYGCPGTTKGNVTYLVVLFLASTPMLYGTKAAALHQEQTFFMASAADQLDMETQQSFPTHLSDARWTAAEQCLANALNHPHPWSPGDSKEQAVTQSTFWQEARAQGRMVILEICGGHAGVTKLALRRRWPCGQNMDLCTGVDLTNPKQRHQVIQYVRMHQPYVIVAAPPCTAFGAWSRFNSVMHPHSHRLALLNGSACSRVCAEVSLLQLQGGRHFLVENPQASQLWQRQEWQQLTMQHALFHVTIDQCAAGLVSPTMQPMRKRTTFLSSSPLILSGLKHFQCHCRQPHQQIAGNANGHSLSRWSQQWPPALCQAILSGISLQVKQDMQLPIAATTDLTPAAHHVATMLMYPTAQASTVERRRLDNVRYQCAACKRHMEMTEHVFP
eukprot:6491262-Amphidinium_carterae.1